MANSYKQSERCIAGVDIETGEWIRPVSDREDRAITWAMRTINGQEPEILDVLEIPLEDYGPDEGCQPENRLLKEGCWKKIGRITKQELLEYCEDDSVILHNNEDRVEPSFFKEISKDDWKSLQLVHNTKVKFCRHWYNRRKWRTYFKDGKGNYMELGVTDPAILRRLDQGGELSQDCILTISLTTPWSHNIITPKRCYKLVACVIEL